MRIIPAQTQKMAQFTDIHYGAKDANKEHGPVHNKDCGDFLEYFCDEVTSPSQLKSLFAASVR